MRNDEATALQRLRNVLLIVIIAVGILPWCFGTLMLPGAFSMNGNPVQEKFALLFIFTNPLIAMFVHIGFIVVFALPYKAYNYITKGRNGDADTRGKSPRAIRVLFVVALFIVANLSSCSGMFLAR